MKNCVIAQSGGPTAVINASVMGVVAKNRVLKYYDKVFAGLNGIEGILAGNLLDLTPLTDEEVDTIRYTPAAALGSCRYKLKSAEESPKEYEQLFKVLEDHEIDTLFYAGGNDSMDTVAKLGRYAAEHGKKAKFFGIPKTIDNDLPVMDHTPGFGSAAKLIATTVLENYLDASVYSKPSAFIVEAMGRDTGWLAASATLARIDGKPVADLIYLPEEVFDTKQFLIDAKEILKKQLHLFIVVSEGIRNSEGVFLSELGTQGQKDIFGHVQLGGVGNYIKQLLLDGGVVSKARALEISTTQRCGMHVASQTDLSEAYAIGETVMAYSIDGESGHMGGIKRISNEPYSWEPFTLPADQVANRIKYFPKEWVNSGRNGVTDEAYRYFLPLIQGDPEYKRDHGMPRYVQLSDLLKKD